MEDLQSLWMPPFTSGGRSVAAISTGSTREDVEILAISGELVQVMIPGIGDFLLWFVDVETKPEHAAHRSESLLG